MGKQRYNFEIRRKAVLFVLEKGYSRKRVCLELGITDKRSVTQWVHRYKAEGEEGLKDRTPKMKDETRKARSEKRELEYLRAENALFKYLLKTKKKDDTKRLKPYQQNTD